MSDDRAGAGEGPDADESGHAKDEGERSSAHDVASDDPHKAEKLVKAGQDDFDPNAGTE